MLPQVEMTAVCDPALCGVQLVLAMVAAAVAGK